MLRNVLIIFLLISFVVLTIYCYCFYRWNHLWQNSSPIPYYKIECHNDDTLKILVIGDSWAEIHSDLRMDSFLCSRLQEKVSNPVLVTSKGKGGEKCKRIYQLMFERSGYGTRTLFEKGVDYCIIFAGINDAAVNWGTKQFCYHYKLIIEFLLHNHICPIVVEIPDVDIWNMYKNKPIKDKLTDFLKATMTRSMMYDYHNYREALYEMLQKDKLLDKVIYVPMTNWNGYESEINPKFFMEDRVHLNSKGYHKLDECISVAIANHLHQSKDSTLVDNSVN